MKILFISHYSFLYGSNRSLDSLVDAFIEKGEDVSVLLPSKGKFYYHLKEKGVNVYAFRFFYEVLYVKFNRKYLSLPLLWIFNLLMMPFLIFKIKRLAPDVIYSNSSVDAYSIFFAKLLRIKHVWHVREFLKEDFGSHFILGKELKKKLILQSDKIIFVSKAVADSVIGYIPTNGKVIYNGLPYPQKLRNEVFFDSELKLGVVGNIDISKQQHLAIEYMEKIHEKYPKMTLHIIGDKECPYKYYIQKLVSKLDLQNVVKFDGFVGNVEDIYSKIDVLLMCSRSEAFGRVTIEAMLRNIPVIGIDSGGTSELICNGVTGFKFHNVQEVIAALDVIVNDSDKTKDIINEAKSVALIKFSEQTYVNNIYNYVKYGN